MFKYGDENWTIDQKDISKTYTRNRRFLKSITGKIKRNNKKCPRAQLEVYRCSQKFEIKKIHSGLNIFKEQM